MIHLFRQSFNPQNSNLDKPEPNRFFKMRALLIFTSAYSSYSPERENRQPAFLINLIISNVAIITGYMCGIPLKGA
jgi:hypothetical protein